MRPKLTLRELLLQLIGAAGMDVRTLENISGCDGVDIRLELHAMKADGLVWYNEDTRQWWQVKK